MPKVSKVTKEETPVTKSEEKTVKGGKKLAKKEEPVVVEEVVPEVKETKSKKAGKATKVEKVEEVEEVKEAVKEVKPKGKKAKKVVEPEPEVEEDDQEEVQEGGKRKRFFRCMYDDNTFGRFCGYKPKQAANKALTTILKQRKQDGESIFDEVGFSMVECTRGRPHRVSQYTGKRIQLDEPVVVEINTNGVSKKIEYNFTNKVTKVKAVKVPKAPKVKAAKQPKKKATKKGKVSKKVSKA